MKGWRGKRLGLVQSGAFGEVVHLEVAFCMDILGPGSRYTDPDAPSSFAALPGGAVADFATHLAYMSYAFLGEHRSVRTTWRKRSAGHSLPWDEFGALVDAERGTAVLAFSAHAQPDAFLLRVHGTRMRATASLFEPLLAIERVRGGPRPLMPVVNGLSIAAAYARSGISGLWRKLAGRTATHEGLWTLLERFYAAIETGSESPVPPSQIAGASRLVWELLADAEKQ